MKHTDFTFRCYFEGVKIRNPDPDLVLRLELSTNGCYFDNDPKLLNFQSDHKFTPARAFVGDARAVTFEYDPAHPECITCDGEYGQERDYTMLTPMTYWTIRILDDEYGTIKRSDLDFSGFTGLRMEFLCEFTRPNYETLQGKKLLS